MPHCEDCGCEFREEDHGFFPFVLALKKGDDILRFDILAPSAYKAASRNRIYSEVDRFTSEADFMQFCITVPNISLFVVQALMCVDRDLLNEGCEFGFTCDFEGKLEELQHKQARQN